MTKPTHAQLMAFLNEVLWAKLNLNLHCYPARGDAERKLIELADKAKDLLRRDENGE